VWYTIILGRTVQAFSEFAVPCFDEQWPHCSADGGIGKGKPESNEDLIGEILVKITASFFARVEVEAESSAARTIPTESIDSVECRRLWTMHI